MIQYLSITVSKWTQCTVSEKVVFLWENPLKNFLVGNLIFSTFVINHERMSGSQKELTISADPVHFFPNPRIRFLNIGSGSGSGSGSYLDSLFYCWAKNKTKKLCHFLVSFKIYVMTKIQKKLCRNCILNIIIIYRKIWMTEVFLWSKDSNQDSAFTG